MDTPQHPDPFRDAMSHGLQRAVQVASSVATGAQAYAYLKRTQARVMAERGERARRALAAQIKADRDAARADWAPALDPRWLRQADLIQTARAWGAAMPYADPSTPWHDPAAATAMRACEDRLWELHPNAMARYDRLRGEGMGPAQAMREAMFLFAGPARAQDASYAPRPALDTGSGENLTWTAAGPTPDPEDGPAAADAQELRGRQIVEALQARARAEGRDPLAEAEQRTVLETVTNLPADVINRVVRRDTAAGLTRTEQDRAATAERARASDLDAAADLRATPGADERTQNLVGARDAAATADGATARAARATRAWEQDFPVPITDVVAAAGSAARIAATSPDAAAARAVPQARRAGPRP
jgi:hypothetical protein